MGCRERYVKIGVELGELFRLCEEQSKELKRSNDVVEELRVRIKELKDQLRSQVPLIDHSH